MRIVTCLAGLALVACSPATADRADASQDVAAAPPSNAHADGSPVPAAPKSLASFVGKTPYEVVDGQAFIDSPQVRLALESSGAPAKALALARDRDTVTSPIFRSETALVASGYDPRSGGDVNWALAITPDGQRAIVCYMEGPVGHLYENGQRTHPVRPRCFYDAETAADQLFEWP